MLFFLIWGRRDDAEVGRCLSVQLCVRQFFTDRKCRLETEATYVVKGTWVGVWIILKEIACDGGVVELRDMG